MLKLRLSVRSTQMLCVLATLVAVAMPSYGVTINNGDFETGSFSGWTQDSGLWYGGNNYPTSYTFNGGPYQSAIVTPGDVPCLASYNVHISEVYAGNYAARINNNLHGGYDFSQIQQTFTNWDASYLTFWWSAVLMDSGHNDPERPHFRVMVNDLTTSTLLFDYSYNSDNLKANFFTTGPSEWDLSYSGWQQLQINLPGHLHDDLKLTILAADCAMGAHTGALYVDDIIANQPGGNQLPVAVPVVAPTTVQYGQLLTLDGTGSYDFENETLDVYDWDFNGDGIPDLSGGSIQNYTVPNTWSIGSKTMYLRVHEIPGNQWSLWAPVSLTVVPEPSTITLIGIGAFGLLAYGWRRRRQAA
jgi:hypothetical protein